MMREQFWARPLHRIGPGTGGAAEARDNEPEIWGCALRRLPEDSARVLCGKLWMNEVTTSP